MTESAYIHGTAAEEQQRLTALNDLLNAQSLRELELQPGDRVLDVGCGLAQLTRSMARQVGTKGRVVGIDASPEQLAEANRQAEAEGEAELVELRQGEAQSVPLQDDEWGTFDVVHGRFVLEHVTDPLAVVKGMVRAAHVGGRLVLQDDDHGLLRFYPELPAVDALWQAYIQTYVRLGMDPYVGRRLTALLAEAGAKPRRTTCLFFGGCRGGPTFTACVSNLAGLFEGARERMLEWKLIGQEAFAEALSELTVWSRKEGAAIWYALPWAEGVKE